MTGWWPAQILRATRSFRARLLGVVAFAVALPVLISCVILGFQINAQSRAAFNSELKAKLAIIATTIQDAAANVAGGVTRAASDNTLQLTLDLGMDAQLARYADVQRDILGLSQLNVYDTNLELSASSVADVVAPLVHLSSGSLPPGTDCLADASLARQIVACGTDVYLVAVAEVGRPSPVSVGDANPRAPVRQALGFVLGAKPLVGDQVIGLLRQRGIETPMVWLNDTVIFPRARDISPAVVGETGGTIDFSVDGSPYLGSVGITTYGDAVVKFTALTPLAPLRAALFQSILTVSAVGFVVGLATLVGLGLLTRRLLQPVEVLKSGAQHIERGDLGYRITISSGDELQDLGDRFNNMAVQLQASYAQLERKVEERTQQLAEANLAKSQFLAAASHDLRQPLHALNLFVDQLGVRTKDGSEAQLVQQIGASVAAMNDMFADLLDMAKLDSGLLLPRSEPFEISKLLDRVHSTFAPAAAEKGLTFQVVPKEAIIESDFVLLERIVFNLVSNAVKYTETGGILVGCRRRGCGWRIDVVDTGHGIPVTLQTRIFGEFVQLKNERTGRAGTGLGLGLAIVDRLAGLLKHPIEVVSKPARGSRFSIHVPAGTLALRPAEGVHRDADLIDPLRNILVLVVDDDAQIRDSMERVLKSWGARVVLAGSRAGAISCVMSGDEPPDLIVSDYQLGGTTGVDLFDEIRAMSVHQIPALIVTGDTSAEVSQLAGTRGYPILHKPVSPMKLRAAMTNVLMSQPASVARSRIATVS